ncbi:aminotransferase class III-fold pyridoxal phosphate-dependent enzyme [Alkalibaculum sp. M08DMB]|uniref:Aminotransferase class III-fold pyridoxal phosphate-dependent enzyme n=1 Tax=Alkalibaculum sporogenes TaxID=2655001 RepID=A0A6A7K8C9_9FIRM|nr:transaminase [Alkalibaculum sporogenes]MPW25571.1 aminotransferase class III-fold pyridoxal phosphate-dependent enzyme [Alkalibaculum sporogenes]
MINREKLKIKFEEEMKMFDSLHPASKKMFDKAKESLLQGVPLNWMVRWMGEFPIFVEKAEGAHFTDVDGIEYVDFCLGDTGSLVGHGPKAAKDAILNQFEKGASFMLPTEDAIWVGAELKRRFKMKFWQFSTSATDANRFALRLARRVTGRSKVLVFNWCYHGTVDESIASLNPDGSVSPRKGNIGFPVDPSITTKVVEWNDPKALEEALKDEDVAAVLCEPVMTNVGVVLPDPGFHDILRKLTKKHGTVLIIDETHTMCASIGGFTYLDDLEPDVVTLGKFVASGIPAGAYGMSEEFGKRAVIEIESEFGVAKGIGGTLAANALTMAAIRATLGEILTEEFYVRNMALAEKFNKGVQSVIDEFELPWSTTQLGCRTEYVFSKTPTRTGTEAIEAKDNDLDWYLHLACLNRGVIMTPFHNMALMTTATTQEDVDKHTHVLREVVKSIVD